MKSKVSTHLIEALLPFIGVLVFIFVTLLILGGLFLFFKTSLIAKLQKTKKDNYYVALPSLLSKAEGLFYESLYTVIGHQYCIYPKVRLADLVDVKSNLERSTQFGARNRINQKHVDFVLCSSGDYRIVAVVELDDSSHQRLDRVNRDNFIDETLHSVGIPILHVRAARQYSPEELAAQIEALFSSKQNAEPFASSP
jgi:very-short-patch-repair endonuclease